MSDRDTGGPAFPLASPELCSHDKVEGMTLRDWFAGKALPSIINTMPNAPNETIVRQVYGIADAMLKERNK